MGSNEKEIQQMVDLLQKLSDLGIVFFNKKEEKYCLSYGLQTAIIPRSLGFNEIAILQNKNICSSRLETDISSEVIRGIVRPIPFMASNMSSVTNSDFCIQLYELGALGIMHRALPDDYLIKEIEKISDKCDVVCASVGLGEDQVVLCKKLIDAGANVIFIDVAHGYSDFVIEQGRKIKVEFPEIKLVLGNCINPNMIYEIYDFADALKVGIANGLSCKTKNTASCNEGQFTSVYKFKKLSREFGIPIISDGGVREPADFTKAIAAGANSVMAGSVFARCPESAAEIVEVDGIRKKVYAGMASRLVQDVWKNGVKPGTCTEGKINYLDIGEPITNLLERYVGALRSGITYAGAKDLKGFQEKVCFVKVK
jgi:IMP dehydrogenase/GMP reductase